MSGPQQLCRAAVACLTKQSLLANPWQQLASWQSLHEDQQGAFYRHYAVMPDRQQQVYQLPHKVQQMQQQHQQQPFPQQPQQVYQQQQIQQQQPQASQSQQEFEKIYRGKWIVPVRFLVRGKVFQLIGCGSIGILLGTMNMQEATWMDIAALTGLATGMVAASCCLWYYSRRYVGEMSLLLPDKQHVRFSVLDFWGNRENSIVPLSQLQPPFKGIRPKEMSRIASQLLFPVNVPGDRQYYLSIHAGQILNKEVFLAILKGEFDPKKPPQQAATTEQQSQTQAPPVEEVH